MVVQPRHRRRDVAAGGGGAEQRVLDAVAARRRRTPEVGHLQARLQHTHTSATLTDCDVTQERTLTIKTTHKRNQYNTYATHLFIESQYSYGIIFNDIHVRKAGVYRTIVYLSPKIHVFVAVCCKILSELRQTGAYFL